MCEAPRQKRLRIETKHLLFTYPKCPAPKDIVFNHINHVLNNYFQTSISYAVYCNELHEDGSVHSHAAIFTKETVRISKTNLAYFDLLYGSSRYHPNIQSMKCPSRGIDYVKKHGDFDEFGICPIKQKLSKRDTNLAFINGNWKGLVLNGDISIGNLKNYLIGLQMFKNELQNECTQKQKRVYWLYGETGSGKSYTAFHEGVEGEICKDPQRKVWRNIIGGSSWFDGYDGQSIAIFDDLRKSSFRFEDLLRITDVYTERVNVKCSTAIWCPDTIYITCPVPPRELFVTIGDDGERREWDNINQLLRRISRVYHCWKDDDGYHREVDYNYDDNETN